MELSIFEKAAKQKLRFETSTGKLNVEDLFDLKLEDLDALAVQLQESLRQKQQGSFIAKAKPGAEKELLRFEVAKRIIRIRIEEFKEKEARIKNQQKKEKILEILEEKEASEFYKKHSELGLDDLRKLAESL